MLNTTFCTFYYKLKSRLLLPLVLVVVELIDKQLQVNFLTKFVHNKRRHTTFSWDEKTPDVIKLCLKLRIYIHQKNLTTIQKLPTQHRPATNNIPCEIL